MQDFIQLMITSMELKGFAKNTQKTYLGHISAVLRNFAAKTLHLPGTMM